MHMPDDMTGTYDRVEAALLACANSLEALSPHIPNSEQRAEVMAGASALRRRADAYRIRRRLG